MKTTLMVLTLNEIEGMKAVMPRVKREWRDDSSFGNTYYGAIREVAGGQVSGLYFPLLTLVGGI